MKIGLNAWPFNDKPLEDVLKFAKRVGFEAIELAVDTGRDNHLNIDRDKILKGGATAFKRKVEEYGLEISALSAHLDGQLVGGPHGEDTDTIFKGTPEEKIKYGTERMKKAALAAAALDVKVVNGFLGCENFSRWFHWPGGVELWERGYQLLVERWSEILDVFEAHGVKFAAEPFPQQQAYNIETAEKMLEAFNYRKCLGLNLDPANLIWCSVDPIVYARTFGERIFSVHAKDAEIVVENLRRSGAVSAGDPKRPDTGFRFRVVGWGQIDWRRFITALIVIGYDGVLSVEHEDPWIGRTDGCKKAFNFLKQLIPEPEEEWAR